VSSESTGARRVPSRVAQRSEAVELERFRRAKDAFFRADPASPLTPAQRQRFAGLAYFPFEPSLRIVAVLDRHVIPDEVGLQTTSGDLEPYRRVGVVGFRVGMRVTQVTVFRSRAGELFVPFRDATWGTETYPAGRYLEAEQRDDDRVMIDLNYAYNPYCAYNARWRCPLPPPENHLDVPLRAGERMFPDAEQAIDVGHRPPATAS
jgi:uncharacterized protein